MIGSDSDLDKEELALRFVLGKSSFAKGVRWLPQNNPAASCVARKEVVLMGDHLFSDSFFFYLAMTVPARKEGGLRVDPLLPYGSSLLQICCYCSPADEEYWRHSTAPQIITRARATTGPH